MAEEVKEVKKPRTRTAKVEKPAEKVETPVAKPVQRRAKSGKKSNPNTYIATGRRKDAVARVRLIANGTGKITINDRDIDDYFMLDTLKLIVRQPLKLTDTEGKYDIVANVYGGGYTHSTYDGKVLDVEDSGIANMYIEDKNLITYIDKAVTGNNIYTIYKVEYNSVEKEE